MKAIRVEKQGGPEVLKLLDVAPIKAPGPGANLPSGGANLYRMVYYFAAAESDCFDNGLTRSYAEGNSVGITVACTFRTTSGG